MSIWGRVKKKEDWKTPRILAQPTILLCKHSLRFCEDYHIQKWMTAMINQVLVIIIIRSSRWKKNDFSWQKIFRLRFNGKIFVWRLIQKLHCHQLYEISHSFSNLLKRRTRYNNLKYPLSDSYSSSKERSCIGSTRRRGGGLAPSLLQFPRCPLISLCNALPCPPCVSQN